MTTPLRAGHLLDDPGELIAALPSMLHFRPAESVVLVTFTGTRDLELEGVMRMNLPEPEHLADVVDQMRVAAVNHDATAVELVVLGGGNADPPDGLPHRDLIEALDDVLDAEGVVLAHSVWAPRVERGATWWCYDDNECTGQVRDPATSPITTEMTVAGAVTFASREEMAMVLAADPAEVLARRAALLDALAGADSEPAGETALRRDLELVRSTIEGVAASRDAAGQYTVPAMDDEAIVGLIRALSHPDVRDVCLAFGLTRRARAAEMLWMFLIRATPGTARADPASLLSASSFLNGQGALATMAMDAAVEANPDHRLGLTMRQVIGNAVTPSQFLQMLAESFALVITRSAHPSKPCPPFA